jgi:hypothetical protein
VASITTKKKEIKYYENGAVSEKSFNWRTEDLKFRNDFDSHLIVKFDRHGQITKISYDRAYRIDNWIWHKGKLIESPKKWKGPLPWKRFPEIQVK